MSAFKKSMHSTETIACEAPCSTMDISYGVLFSDGTRTDGKSSIRFYLKSNVEFKQTIYDYTLLSLLADIGGYTGILLGVSVANVSTIFEKIRQYVINV